MNPSMFQPDEVWLRLAFASAEVDAWTWDIAAGTVTFLSDVFRSFCLPPGQQTYTVDEVRATISPLDLPAFEQAVAAALIHDGPHQLQVRVRAPTGQLRWIEVRGIVQHNPAGQPVRVVGVIRDVSAEQQRAAAQALQVAIGQAFRTQMDIATTLQSLAQLPMPDLADSCVIYLLEDDATVRPAVALWGDPARPVPATELPPPAPLDRERGPLSAALRTGAPQIIADASPDLAPWLGPLAPRSALLVPLIAQDRTLGVMQLGLTSNERRYGANDLALAEILAQRGAEALVQAQLREAAQSAQQVATEALSRLDAIFTSAPTGIAYLDHDLRYVLVNPAMARINGRTPAEHLGRTLAEVIPVLSHQLESLVRPVLATGEAVRNHALRGHLCQQDELIHNWIMNIYPVAGDGGKVVGVGVTLTDITEHKRFEAALRETERKLGTLFALLPIGISILDVEQNVVYANPALEQILQMDYAGLLNGEHRKRWYLRPDGTPMPQEEKARSRVFREQQAVFDVETGVITESGAVIWLSISAVPVDFPDWRVVMVTTDITARTQAMRDLKYERQLLAAILNTMHEGVIAIRPDRTLALINPAALRLGDHDPAAPPRTLMDLGRTPNQVLDAYGQPMAKEASPLLRVLRGERFAGMEACLRSTIDRTEHWDLLNGAPVYDEASTLILGLITFLDITDRKRAELALAAHDDMLSRTNIELTRALRLKDEFLAMMSHELRTPLSVILGICQAMDEDLYGPINAEQRQALDTVTKSGRHLLGILSEILDLTFIEGGQAVIERQPIDVDSICQSAMQFVQSTAQQKGIRLLRSVEQGVVGLTADERRLTQILVNLLENAVKFTPTGGMVGLEVIADHAQECIQFVVWDTGIGIADADYDRLFQPFTQVDGKLSRSYGGVGLGLTLVRRLVDLHGGSIHLESALGQGSRFTISLPWADRDNVAPRDARVAEPHPRTWVQSPRVVIADDHEPTLAFYRDMLTKQAVQVAVARTGEEALAHVQAIHPDVAVLDIQMPGIDGLEVIRRIRADPAVATVPIIALTALAMPGDRERCFAAGANAYLAKPVGLRTLIATITRMLIPDSVGEKPIGG